MHISTFVAGGVACYPLLIGSHQKFCPYVVLIRISDDFVGFSIEFGLGRSEILQYAPSPLVSPNFSKVPFFSINLKFGVFGKIDGDSRESSGHSSGGGLLTSFFRLAIGANLSSSSSQSNSSGSSSGQADRSSAHGSDCSSH